MDARVVVSNAASCTDREVQAARVRECPSDLRKQQTVELVPRGGVRTHSATSIDAYTQCHKYELAIVIKPLQTFLVATNTRTSTTQGHTADGEAQTSHHY